MKKEKPLVVRIVLTLLKSLALGFVIKSLALGFVILALAFVFGVLL